MAEQDIPGATGATVAAEGPRPGAGRVGLVLVVAVLLIVVLTVLRVALAGSGSTGAVWVVVGIAFGVGLVAFVAAAVELVRLRRDRGRWDTVLRVARSDPQQRREVVRTALRGLAMPAHVDVDVAVAVTGWQSRLVGAIGFAAVGGLAGQVVNVGNAALEDPVLRWAPLLTQGLSLFVVLAVVVLLARTRRAHALALERWNTIRRRDVGTA